MKAQTNMRGSLKKEDRPGKKGHWEEVQNYVAAMTAIAGLKTLPFSARLMRETTRR